MNRHQTLNYIEGQGGGGGSSSSQSAPTTAPNDLRTQSTARLLFLMGYGETGGLYDQANPLKSIYINNVPVMNADGSLNKNNTIVSEVYGLPSQGILPGYASVSDTAGVGQNITVATPVTYTTSVNNIDSIRVTVRIPALYSQSDNGSTDGTTVQLSIWRAVGSGSYSKYGDFVKTGKCIAPADIDYLVPRPAGSTGIWSVQLRRSTPDSTSERLVNQTIFQFATEVQEVQKTYNGYSVIGLTTTADTGGSAYPTVAFDYVGRKVKVPSNYNVTTRQYTGGWDGTFAPIKHVCDNPAWVLYDMITDPQAGMGDFVKESDVNAYSFYDAAVYNDGLVPNADNTGTEPRFTFNYQFMDQEVGWSQVQKAASSSLCIMVNIGGKVSLVQDRPTGWSRLITNSNVIKEENGDQFTYASASSVVRSPACLVNWTDPSQNWLKVPAYFQDDAAVDRYGFSQTTVDGVGVTSHGHALRLARWFVDTAINQTETLSFKVGLQNAGMSLGDVIKVADSDLAEVMLEAKVVSSGAGTLTLDKPLTVVAGNTLDVTGDDGLTTYTRTISASSTGTVVSYSGAAVSVLPGATFVLSAAVVPRLFKVTAIRESSSGIYEVGCLEYDSNKFARVDDTPQGPAQVYQLPASQAYVAPVQNISFTEESYTNPEGLPKRRLAVHWEKPAGALITAYTIFWVKDDGTPTQIDASQALCYVPVDADGIYTVTVYAINARRVRSQPATAEHAVSLAAPTNASALLAVTGLTVKGGGTTFNGTDCVVVWTNPNVNGANGIVGGFEVKVIDATSPTNVYRTETVQFPTYTYDLTKQKTDNGTNLKRTFIISVRVKDTWGRFSPATAVTFLNPAPAVPSPISVLGTTNSINVAIGFPSDPDYAGYLIWMSATQGFTPSASNKVFEGTDSFNSFTNVTPGTTYYFRIAAYDVFGKDYTGAGMNVSSEFSATASSAGIASVASLPPTAHEGDVVILTTDGQLYRYHNMMWTNAVPAVDITGNLTDSQIGSLSAAKLTGQITSTQITDNSISTQKIQAASITGAQLAAGSVVAGTIAAGAVVAGTIQAGAVTATELATNSVTAVKILAGTISGDKIAANTISAGNIAANTITGDRIAGGTITANNIATGSLTAATIQSGSLTSTQIAAGSITGDRIAAATLTAANLSVVAQGATANMIRNSDFTQFTGTNNGIASLKEWTWGTNITDAMVNRNYADGTVWNVGLGGAWMFDSTQQGNTGAYYNLIESTNQRVQPGYAVEISAYVSAHRCQANIDIHFKRSDGSDCQSGAYAGGATLNAGGDVVGGSSGVSTMYRLWGTAVAPSDAFYACIRIYKYSTNANASSGSYLFINRTMMCYLPSAGSASNQTPWNDGGITTINGGGIVTSTITADKISVGNLSALTATIGLLRTAGSGARTEIADNQLRVYDESNALRIKLGYLG